MKKLFLLFPVLLLSQAGMAQNNAGVVSISAPASVAPGANFSATITMTNTGANAWTVAGAYNFGSEIPRDNARWGTGRVPLPTDPINPGDIAAFTATFTAPTEPGVYHFAWGMVQDGVEWFGAIASTAIKVGTPQFTAGDLVVMQVGDGVRAIINTGTPMFLNNFSISGLSNTFQVALPVTGSNALITGASVFTGMIDLSTDGRFIVVGGYNTNLPHITSVELAGSPVPRAVGTVNSSGDFTFNVSSTTAFTGSTFRGVVSDGLGNFWAGAQNSGIQYLGTNSPPVQISTLGSGAGTGAIRDLIMVNGSIYFSTSQFPAPGNHGVAAFTGSPTTPLEPELVINTTAIPGATGTPNVKGFAINTNLTMAYVADMRTAGTGGGLYRFNGNGTGTNGSWTYAYTLINDLSTEVFQEVRVDFSGANPKIYAIVGTATGTSAGNSLISTTDTGAASTWTLLQTAPAGTAYRGLVFAPTASGSLPVFLSITRFGTDVVISWTGVGTLQSANVVTGPYVSVAGSPTSPYTNAPSGTNQFYRVSIP